MPKFLKLLFCCCLLFISSICIAQTVKNTLTIAEKNTTGSFPLFNKTIAPTVYFDADDARVVKIAAEAFLGDFNLVSGKQLKLNSSNTIHDGYAIIAGTIGQSKIIDALIKEKQVDVNNIKNKWESLTIKVINKNKLVIAGSDSR